MPAVGLAELFLILVIAVEVVAQIALPILAVILVVRFLRQRGARLDRIERRLDDLDRRAAPPKT
jgi:hypothetical protein